MSHQKSCSKLPSHSGRRPHPVPQSGSTPSPGSKVDPLETSNKDSKSNKSSTDSRRRSTKPDPKDPKLQFTFSGHLNVAALHPLEDRLTVHLPGKNSIKVVRNPILMGEMEPKVGNNNADSEENAGTNGEKKNNKVAGLEKSAPTSQSCAPLVTPAPHSVAAQETARPSVMLEPSKHCKPDTAQAKAKSQDKGHGKGHDNERDKGRIKGVRSSLSSSTLHSTSVGGLAGSKWSSTHTPSSTPSTSLGLADSKWSSTPTPSSTSPSTSLGLADSKWSSSPTPSSTSKSISVGLEGSKWSSSPTPSSTSQSNSVGLEASKWSSTPTSLSTPQSTSQSTFAGLEASKRSNTPTPLSTSQSTSQSTSVGLEASKWSSTPTPLSTSQSTSQSTSVGLEASEWSSTPTPLSSSQSTSVGLDASKWSSPPTPSMNAALAKPSCSSISEAANKPEKSDVERGSKLIAGESSNSLTSLGEAMPQDPEALTKSEHYQEEVRRLSEVNQKLEQERKELANYRTSQAQEINRLKSDIQRLEQEKKDFANHKSSQVQEINRLNSDNQRLEQEKKEFASHKNSQAQEINRLNSDNRKLEQEKKELALSQSDQTQEINRLKSDNQKLEQKKKDFALSQSDQTQEINRLNSDNRKLEQEKKELASNKTSQAQNINRLKLDNQKLEQEKKESTIFKSDQTQEIKRLNIDNQKLEQEKKELASHKASQAQEINQLKSNNQRLEQEKKEFAVLKSDQRAEINRLLSDIEKFEQESKDYAVHKSKQTEEISRLLLEVKKLEHNLDQESEAVREANERTGQLEADLQQLSVRNNALARTSVDGQSDVKALEIEIEKLREERQAINQKLRLSDNARETVTKEKDDREAELRNVIAESIVQVEHSESLQDDIHALVQFCNEVKKEKEKLEQTIKAYEQEHKNLYDTEELQEQLNTSIDDMSNEVRVLTEACNIQGQQILAQQDEIDRLQSIIEGQAPTDSPVAQRDSVHSYSSSGTVLGFRNLEEELNDDETLEDEEETLDDGISPSKVAILADYVERSTQTEARAAEPGGLQAAALQIGYAETYFELKLKTIVDWFSRQSLHMRAFLSFLVLFLVYCGLDYLVLCEQRSIWGDANGFMLEAQRSSRFASPTRLALEILCSLVDFMVGGKNILSKVSFTVEESLGVRHGLFG